MTRKVSAETATALLDACYLLATEGRDAVSNIEEQYGRYLAGGMHRLLVFKDGQYDTSFAGFGNNLCEAFAQVATKLVAGWKIVESWRVGYGWDTREPARSLRRADGEPTFYLHDLWLIWFTYLETVERMDASDLGGLMTAEEAAVIQTRSQLELDGVLERQDAGDDEGSGS